MLTEQLGGLGDVVSTMAFGGPEEWPDGCILVHQTPGSDALQALRRTILGPSARVYDAHVTLLDPGNASGVLHNPARIAGELDGLVLTFRTVCMVEQSGCEPWHKSRANTAPRCNNGLKSFELVDPPMKTNTTQEK